MDEIAKALGPWPILQLIFGVIVLGVGVYAIIRGVNKGGERKNIDLDEQRARWDAFKHLEHIEENSFKIAASQERMVEQVNRLVDVIWNQRNLPPRN